MPPIGPTKRKDLIYYLRQAGYSGPMKGSDHEVMVRGTRTIRIPNPHKGDISKDLLLRLLRQAGITRAEWENLH